uniref:Uncharacterized protein n=1 Tax=Anguilla anguilla TaxID=7936 RepID=A0A0E9RMB8_ANGAN
MTQLCRYNACTFPLYYRYVTFTVCIYSFEITKVECMMFSF